MFWTSILAPVDRSVVKPTRVRDQGEDAGSNAALMGHHFGSPYLQGWNTLTVNQNVNLLTGAVEQWGTIDRRLDGIDGITGGWTGSFSGKGLSCFRVGSVSRSGERERRKSER